MIMTTGSRPKLGDHLWTWMMKTREEADARWLSQDTTDEEYVK